MIAMPSESNAESGPCQVSESESAVPRLSTKSLYLKLETRSTTIENSVARLGYWRRSGYCWPREFKFTFKLHWQAKLRLQWQLEA
jgi:hypothetical protein